MWTDLYTSYFLESITFADVIERIQALGFSEVFQHLDNGHGWLFLMIKDDMGYQVGRGDSLRDALLDGIYDLYTQENEILKYYKKML